MRVLIPLAFLLVPLAGCAFSTGNTTVSVVAAEGGGFSATRTSISAGTARFQCFHGSGSRCHYLVYEPVCSETAGAAPAYSCVPRAVHRFELASGQVREVHGLRAGATWCMDLQAAPRLPGCRKA